MLFFISFLIISGLLYCALKLRKSDDNPTLGSNFLLILSSVIFSLTLVEDLLGLVLDKSSNPTHLASPPYFAQYQPSTFFMVENSTLYTALPNKSYRTFGLP